jgi:hypothetical protein
LVLNVLVDVTIRTPKDLPMINQLIGLKFMKVIGLVFETTHNFWWVKDIRDVESVGMIGNVGSGI